jgi:hypothetical protein
MLWAVVVASFFARRARLPVPVPGVGGSVGLSVIPWLPTDLSDPLRGPPVAPLTALDSPFPGRREGFRGVRNYFCKKNIRGLT